MKMATLSIFTISQAYPQRLHHPHFSPLKSPTPKTLVFVGKSSEPKDSVFRDEDGVINDMDGYLNHLSLEYDSVWDTKPAWCQPWTIGVTGVGVIGCSWLLLHSLLITTLVLTVIGLWWYIFLYSYPKAYSDMIADRRKKVKTGVEDTYGWEKGQ